MSQHDHIHIHTLCLTLFSFYLHVPTYSTHSSAGFQCFKVNQLLSYSILLFSKLNNIVSSLFYLSNEQGVTSSFNYCCCLTSSRANVLIHYVAIIRIDNRSRSLQGHTNMRVIKLILRNLYVYHVKLVCVFPSLLLLSGDLRNGRLSICCTARAFTCNTCSALTTIWPKAQKALHQT